MYKNLKTIYEEDACQRTDIFSKIYNGKEIKKSARISFWAYYFLRLKQLWLERILSGYLKEGITILDTGCGDGHLSNIYAGEGYRIYGLDISLNYLKIAAGKNNSCVFIQGDLLNMPFKDKSIDILICSEVLEHIPDPEKALKEIKRVTRFLFLSTVPVLPAALDYIRLGIYREKEFISRTGHFRHFQTKSYLAFIKEAGFKIKKVQYIGFLWWLFSWPFFGKNIDRKWVSGIDFSISNSRLIRRWCLDIGVLAEP